MECGEYKKQISLMIDGELSPSMLEALSVHLAGCADCQKFCNQLRALDDVLMTHSPAVPTSYLAARAKEGLVQHSKLGLRRNFRLWAGIPAMAMIALLALGLGNLVGKSITEMFGNGQTLASVDLIAPDSGGSLSDALLELGIEENYQ